MLEELNILEIVVGRLDRKSVPYMVTGSVAMNYYAEPRMTRDIDIVIELERKDAETIYNLFKDDFYVSLDVIEQEIEIRGMFSIIHLEEIVKIDFIIRKESGYRELEFSRRRKVKIDDFEAYIVSPEDLILSKLFWAKDSHSELQLNDVKNLLQENVDMDYVEKWAKELEIDDLLLEVLNEGY